MNLDPTASPTDPGNRPRGLFRRLAHASGEGKLVRIEFDGETLSVPAGCSVAAALIAAGVERFRSTPVSGSPRAPYCMMSACFECLVEIDGEPNRQACVVDVRDGMRVRRQEGAREFAAANGESRDAD